MGAVGILDHGRTQERVFLMKFSRVVRGQSLVGLAVMAVAACICAAAIGAQPPLIVGHRGMLRSYPENTLPAFAACVERGIGIEFDVRTAKDGTLIVLHDSTLGRTSNGPNDSPSDFTAAELQQFDAGGWFDDMFRDVRIPTVGETLSLIAKQKTGTTLLAVNLKAITPDGEHQLVAALQRYELLGESFCFDQSQACSRRLKQSEPKIRIGGNVRRGGLQAAVREGLLDVFLVNFVLSPAEVIQLHQAGKIVVLNFSGPGEMRNDPSAWDRAAAAGVDAVLTDFVEELYGHWHHE